MCVAHSLGLDPKHKNSNTANTEGRNNLFSHEGTESMDFRTSIADEDLLEIAHNNEQQLNQRSLTNNDIGNQNIICPLYERFFRLHFY